VSPGIHDEVSSKSVRIRTRLYAAAWKVKIQRTNAASPVYRPEWTVVDGEKTLARECNHETAKHTKKKRLNP